MKSNFVYVYYKRFINDLPSINKIRNYKITYEIQYVK